MYGPGEGGAGPRTWCPIAVSGRRTFDLRSAVHGPVERSIYMIRRRRAVATGHLSCYIYDDLPKNVISESQFRQNHERTIDNMVLHKPENKHVLKAFDLSGKVAAVTGGARGIGLEVSRGLAEAGANVCRDTFF